MSMNLANLLNDGKLKKSFMVATLVSTLFGTFTTAITLHDKVQDKRQQAKQQNLDDSQDKKIEDLREQVGKIQSGNQDSNGNGGGGGSGGGRSRSQSRSRRPRPRRRSTGDDGDSDDFDRSARRNRDIIAREFEDNYRRMGSKYAEGDVISENRLQAQIISLQQSVIDVLQDAMMSGRQLSKADIRRLVAAQDRARQGSLDALRDQYDRMQQNGGRRASLAIDDAPRRQLTLPAAAEMSPDDDSFPPPRRVRTLPAQQTNSSTTSRLYCRYAYDLQTNLRRPLNSAWTSASGSQRCPACDVRIPVSLKDVWVFETRTPIQDDRVEVRSFTMDARLVIKSHTPNGDYACLLCYRDRDRDADCHCASVDALVRHLGRAHTREEFEMEEDMFVDRN